MAWYNLANLFPESSHDFCQLYYSIKQIDFIFLCVCTVIDHRWRHSVWRTKSHALDCVSCVLFCSSHAMTSSVIYYSTDARKNEIYLLSNIPSVVSEGWSSKWLIRILALSSSTWLRWRWNTFNVWHALTALKTNRTIIEEINFVLQGGKHFLSNISVFFCRYFVPYTLWVNQETLLRKHCFLSMFCHVSTVVKLGNIYWETLARTNLKVWFMFALIVLKHCFNMPK